MTTGAGAVLIIGKNGQLARSLRDVLTTSGRRTAAIGRPEIDLCDPMSVKSAIRLAQPAIVINAAGYTAVDRAEDETDAAFAVNASGAQAASEAAAEANAPIIHISTDYVFDGAKQLPYNEIDPVAPIGVYGRSKLAGEEAVAGANPKHVILRTAWLFSPFGANFVKTMLRLNGERPEISVVDDQFGSPTSALDLASSVSGMIGKLSSTSPDPRSFGTFHAVNSGTTTWYGFASAIIDGAHHRGAPKGAVNAISTKDYPTKARRPAYSVLSADKLANVYGIRLRSWHDALSDCLDRLIGPLPHEYLRPLQTDFDELA